MMPKIYDGEDCSRSLFLTENDDESLSFVRMLRVGRYQLKREETVRDTRLSDINVNQG